MPNPIMTGQRVYLRPGEPADAVRLADFYHHEPDDLIVEGGRLPFSPLTFDKRIREWYAQQPPDSVILHVCLNEDDTMIGSVGLFGIDWVNRTAETASIMGPEYRDRGYGTEAKHLLLEYAFDHLQLHLLWATVWQANERSAAALLKQGYRPAGRLKWTAVRRGVYRDTRLFDIKRDEWVAARDARRIPDT